MQITRISLLSFALGFSIIVSSAFSLGSTPIPHTQNTTSWKTSYLDRMSVQELQTLSNIVYLLYANSIIEFKIRQLLQSTTELQHSARQSIDTYKNPTQELALLKTLNERLSYVSSARTIYTQTLSVCMAHYDKNRSALVNAAIERLQRDTQIQLRAWADAQQNTTNEQLKKTALVMSQGIEYFEGAINMYKNMSQGIIPIDLPEDQKQNLSLMTISLVLNNNGELIKLSEGITQSLNETTSHAAEIIQTGMGIYKDYYQELYQVITAPSFDKKHATTLFGMHDVLPDEYKSLLPNPDRVFEHTLQTMKLYTQTEVSKS